MNKFIVFSLLPVKLIFIIIILDGIGRTSFIQIRHKNSLGIDFNIPASIGSYNAFMCLIAR